jgi:hypothetical protein
MKLNNKYSNSNDDDDDDDYNKNTQIMHYFVSTSEWLRERDTKLRYTYIGSRLKFSHSEK